MASSQFGQSWSVYRYSDSEIVLTAVDVSINPLTWMLSFLIGPQNPSPSTTIPAATLTITPTVNGTTITIPITRSQLTTILTGIQYAAALWRTDSGAEKPLATGTLGITTVPTPQN